jgi:hypothetical protein
LGSAIHLPVPVKPTDCGLVAALSLTDKFPERAPVADGLNLMLMVQLAPEFSIVPQVVADCRNSPPIVFVMLIPVSVVASLFLTVITWAALVVPTVCAANVRVAGVTATGTTPVPVSVSDCGLLDAPSVIWTVTEYGVALAGQILGSLIAARVRSAFLLPSAGKSRNTCLDTL